MRFRSIETNEITEEGSRAIKWNVDFDAGAADSAFHIKMLDIIPAVFTQAALVREYLIYTQGDLLVEFAFEICLRATLNHTEYSDGTVWPKGTAAI